jgi:aspartate/methionine/tyrosine aminotransferase
MNTPIPYEVVKQKIKESGLPSVGKATIREIVRLINEIEKATGQKYIRMEMGVPGLEPNKVGVNAEIEALKNGVAQFYPMIDGVPLLKKEIARFVKNFINIEVEEKCCIPTVGSMQGGMAAFLVTNRLSIRVSLYKSNNLRFWG